MWVHESVVAGHGRHESAGECVAVHHRHCGHRVGQKLAPDWVQVAGFECWVGDGAGVVETVAEEFRDS